MEEGGPGSAETAGPGPEGGSQGPGPGGPTAWHAGNSGGLSFVSFSLVRILFILSQCSLNKV